MAHRVGRNLKIHLKAMSCPILRSAASSQDCLQSELVHNTCGSNPHIWNHRRFMLQRSYNSFPAMFFWNYRSQISHRNKAIIRQQWFLSVCNRMFSKITVVYSYYCCDHLWSTDENIIISLYSAFNYRAYNYRVCTVVIKAFKVIVLQSSSAIIAIYAIHVHLW